MEDPSLQESDNQQPIWVSGRVPDGYWNDCSHRSRYMNWLGAKCGFEADVDWYKVTRTNFRRNHGAGFLAACYQDSVIAALRAHLPNVDWKPWLFTRTPQGFWKERPHRVEFMDWLGQRLGYARDTDWYAISQQAFFANGGGGLLATVYNFSPQAALIDYRPDYPWRPWLFYSVPKGFWRKQQNRIDYMSWLGAQLGLESRESWNTIRQKDFTENGGSGLLMNIYKGSPQRAVKEFFDFKS